MAITTPKPGDSASITNRAGSLYDEARQITAERTDKLFAVLLFMQWIGGIIVAIVYSPLAWQGAASEVHIHVPAAIFLGGLIAGLPIALTFLMPGRVITRHAVAVGQMLASALLIHLCGGRIETHFHIFGSLAFLAFYRDWRVLVTATVVIASDHVVRGVFWPVSIFGVVTASPGRVVEHAAWVIFEDIFLMYSIHMGVKQSRDNAVRQAQLEASNAASADVVNTVRATATAVALNSRELNDTARQLSTEADQQSTSVRQTTQAVERIAATSAASAQSAIETDRIAQQCAAKATQGGQAVQDTIAAMKQIAQMINSVEEIAHSTDLLALNAEVQAARVGEHGRGFAVVAMEIRKLAEVSRNVVQEINDLTNQSVNVAERAGGLLDEVVPGVQETATLVQGIAKSSAEQDSSLVEMKLAMSQLQDVSLRNTAASNQLSTTAGEMRTHVDKLEHSMTSLNVDGATLSSNTHSAN